MEQCYAMRQSILHNIPVFGLNRGNIGFLMNEYNDSNLIDRLKEANEIVVHPLEMIALTQEIKNTPNLLLMKWLF